jgi:hypothetical protein
MAALGAPLGGVTGVHCDHCPSSAFSLGGQDAQTPAEECRARLRPSGGRIAVAAAAGPVARISG